MRSRYCNQDSSRRRGVYLVTMSARYGDQDAAFFGRIDLNSMSTSVGEQQRSRMRDVYIACMSSLDNDTDRARMAYRSLGSMRALVGCERASVVSCIDLCSVPAYYDDSNCTTVRSLRLRCMSTCENDTDRSRMRGRRLGRVTADACCNKLAYMSGVDLSRMTTLDA
jgi:hypothetical protein